MKKLILGTLIVISFLSTYIFAGDVSSFYEVKHCYDGDTCVVKSANDIWFKVRLFGIDAQEMPNKRYKLKGQPFAVPARDALNKKIKEKQVSLKQADLDHYNRPIVEIYFENRNINLEMVSEGWAEAYKGKTKRISMKLYFDAEKQAKASKKGIWGLKTYQSPHEFRKQKINGRE